MTALHAYGTNSDADDAVLATALSTLQAAGSGSLLLTGRFKLNTALTLPSMDDLTLATVGWAEFRKGNPASAYTLVQRTADPGPNSKQRLTVRGLRLVGDWQTTQAEVSGSRACQLNYYAILNLQDVIAQDISNMGITANRCGRIYAERCQVYRCARDMFNFSNSGAASLINCYGEHGGDDFLGFNLSAAYLSDTNIQNSLLVKGCEWIGVNGLKVLGGRNVTIKGNRCTPKHYAVQIGYDPSFSEGNRAGVDFLIVDNHIIDLIPQSILGGGTIDTGIFITSPGLAYDRILIDRNRFTRRSFGSSIAYSTLGLGPDFVSGGSSHADQRLYNKTGFTDPTVTLVTGAYKAIRVQTTNGLDLGATVIGPNNTYSGWHATEFVMRTQPAVAADYEWVIPSGATRVEIPVTNRITLPQGSGTFTRFRTNITVGTNKGVNGSQVHAEYSTNGGGSWSLLSTVTIDGTSPSYSPSYSTIASPLPAGTILRICGSNGNGSTALSLSAGTALSAITAVMALPT